ncbi:hypothetical protein ABIB36_002053 [Rhodococcus sp. UYP9]
MTSSGDRPPGSGAIDTEEARNTEMCCGLLLSVLDQPVQ